MSVFVYTVSRGTHGGLMGDYLLMDLKRARKRASQGGVVAHSLGP